MSKAYFNQHIFSLVDAEKELGEFQQLLTQNTDLAERDQVLKNFDRWPNLCALMGHYNPSVGIADLIKREFRIVPHFRTDLTVRRSNTKNVCLIEFEGAHAKSIFEKSDRGVDTWARAFEKGFSQVVDWTWALDHYRQTSDYVDAFGSARPNMVGVLVIGRATSLSSTAQQDRWDWRSLKVKADSFTLTLVTFDQLYEDLAGWIAVKKMDASAI